ncbi:MAG: hypothetical protein GY749_49760 [Desulfobacteraceae bacterium]|nr:hypothetical protein [Desulfobacteraceae bacterium]
MGDSEFVCFAKQIIEEEMAIDPDLIGYKIHDDNRSAYLNFFHSNNTFTENDNIRMLSLQFILTLVSTLVKGDYFRRNDEVQQYIELYNNEFDRASEIDDSLVRIVKFIGEIELDKKSYWYNKANIFTLICELFQIDISQINSEKLKNELEQFESEYKAYYSNEFQTDNHEHAKYFEYSREGVNEKSARDHRGNIIEKLLYKSIDADE